MIEFTLFARSALNLFFGAIFIKIIGHDFLHGLDPGGAYGVLDGIMGLIMAAVLARNNNGNWPAVLCALCTGCADQTVLWNASTAVSRHSRDNIWQRFFHGGNYMFVLGSWSSWNNRHYYCDD